MRGIIGLLLGIGVTVLYFKHKEKADALTQEALAKTKVLLDGVVHHSRLPKAVPNTFNIKDVNYVYENGKFTKTQNSLGGFEYAELTPDEFKMAYESTLDTFM